MKTRWTLASLVLGSVVLASGCEKGPAEDAGSKIDKVGRDVKDTVSPPGPMEKVGRAVDGK